jgi:hypothetical protein
VIRKNRSVYFSIILGFILMLTSGCAKYSAQPLKMLSTQAPSTQTTHISMSYKIYDKKDCKTYLGRNVLKHGYQPIQISITNNSNEEILVSPKNITIPTVTTEKIITTVQSSTMIKAAKAWGTTGLVITGIFLSIITPGLVLLYGSSFKTFVLAEAAWELSIGNSLLIAAPTGGLRAGHANRKIARDYKQKEFCEQIIPPHNYINGIIFVPVKSFNNEFSIELLNTKTNARYILSTTNPSIEI